MLNLSPAPSAMTQDEEEPEDEADREMARLHLKHREHLPRWAYIILFMSSYILKHLYRL